MSGRGPSAAGPGGGHDARRHGPGGRMALRTLDAILRLYPSEFREQLGDELRRSFAQRLRVAARLGGRWTLLVRAVQELAHTLRGAFAERLRSRSAHSSPLYDPRFGGPVSRPRAMSRFLDAGRRDLCHAARRLARSPGFTLTVVLTLGLAIGANTAIFSVVDTYLLRPLPYPEPDRLALVTRVYLAGGVASGQDGLTWEAVRDGVGDGIRVAVYSDSAPEVNLATGSTAMRVAQQRVGAGYFRTLGVTPRLGRGFSAEEDRPGGPAVTVLGHRMWQLLFGGDPDAVGETVLLKGEPHTVVGVMPEGFRSDAGAELWVPLRASTAGEGSGTNYRILARLENGTSRAAAEARLRAVGQALLEEGSEYQGSRFDRLELQSLQAGDTEKVRRPLVLLWISVAVVLLVACVNVSGLLLVRASRRRREIATRMAIGGSRTAVLRELAVESLVLALAAGAVGVALAYGMVRALADVGRGLLVTWRPVALDGRVLLLALGLSLATAVVFGLVPALQARRLSINEALSEGGGRSSTGGVTWARRLLVATEVALSVVLLVMAGLLLRTFLHLQGGDPGFEFEGTVAVSVSLADARYESRDRVRGLFAEGMRRVGQLAEVDSTAAALSLPYQRPLNIGFEPVDFEVRREGYKITNLTYVTPGFFETLRVPVLQGRAFDVTDALDAEPVTVVNEAFVRTYMPETRPVDRSIATVGAERRIVGVVRDIKVVDGSGLTRGPLTATPMVYVPLSQVPGDFLQAVHTWFAPSWVVRVRGPASAAIPEIEGALASVDPLLPLASTRLLGQIQAQSLRQERLMATLVSLLGLASIVLAGLGIYGLVASAVTERRREIGIRMALGAGAGHAMRVAVGPSVRWAAVGAVLGIGGSILAGRALSAMLWGVQPLDPWTYAGVAVTFVVAASVASLIPARRAARVDPARTLAAE